MAQAKQGDTVSIHYTGRLQDGSVFDSSRSREPIEFTLGEGKVIPGFERAVEGMEPGEEKTTEIGAQDAYGSRRDDLLMTVAREQLPESLEPSVGQQLQMKTTEGRVVQVVVTGTDDSSIVIDANHPLAGEDLTFQIELVKIG